MNIEVYQINLRKSYTASTDLCSLTVLQKNVPFLSFVTEPYIPHKSKVCGLPTNALVYF
jgi:hypothetical protein